MRRHPLRQWVKEDNFVKKLDTTRKDYHWVEREGRYKKEENVFKNFPGCVRARARELKRGRFMA